MRAVTVENDVRVGMSVGGRLVVRLALAANVGDALAAGVPVNVADDVAVCVCVAVDEAVAA